MIEVQRRRIVSVNARYKVIMSDRRTVDHVNAGPQNRPGASKVAYISCSMVACGLGRRFTAIDPFPTSKLPRTGDLVLKPNRICPSHGRIRGYFVAAVSFSFLFQLLPFGDFICLA